MEPYYQSDGVTLYHGDCREIMHTMKPDVVLTDPPYGVGFRGEPWDQSIPQWWLPMALSVSKLVAFTTAPLTIYDYPKADWIGCWVRQAATSRTVHGAFNHWSPILVYGKPIWKCDTVSLHAIANRSLDAGEHPSPKPYRLAKWMTCSLSKPGDVVLDPFSGSGTFLVEARAEGRVAIGIEIEERYCEIAAKRLSQGVLFR